MQHWLTHQVHFTVSTRCILLRVCSALPHSSNINDHALCVTSITLFLNFKSWLTWIAWHQGVINNPSSEWEQITEMRLPLQQRRRVKHKRIIAVECSWPRMASIRVRCIQNGWRCSCLHRSIQPKRVTINELRLIASVTAPRWRTIGFDGLSCRLFVFLLG